MRKFIQKFEVTQGAASSKFAIKNVQKEKNQCNPHWHDHYEIIFVRGDKFNLTTINANIPLEKYSIVIIPPYIIHDTIAEEDFSEVTVVSLSAVFWTQIVSSAENLLISFFEKISVSLTPTIGILPNNKEAEHIFKNIEKEYVNYSLASDAIVHGNLLVLFGLLFKNFKVSSSGEDSPNDEFFDSVKVKKYIMENLTCKLSLANVATNFNYSPTYFSKIFKRNMGISFNDYLNSLKIKKAQELLFLQNKSTAEVAELLNYESPQNFCRIYKQKTGFSPYQHKTNYKVNISPFFEQRH